jgi:hypothetical protein
MRRVVLESPASAVKHDEEAGRPCGRSIDGHALVHCVKINDAVSSMEGDT